MSLRETITKAFAKRFPPVREEANRAARTPDQITAAHEKVQQHKDLVASRDAIMNEQRAKAALDRPEPVNTPRETTQIKSKKTIEKIAAKATETVIQAKTAEIDRKTDARLNADAKERPAREAAAARAAQQAKADAAKGENNRQPAREMAKVGPPPQEQAGDAVKEDTGSDATHDAQSQPENAVNAGSQDNTTATPDASPGLNLWHGEPVHTPEEWREIERLIDEQDRAAIIDEGRTHTSD